MGWVFRLDLFVIQVVSWSQLIGLHTFPGRFHRSSNKISYRSGNSNGKVNKNFVASNTMGVLAICKWKKVHIIIYTDIVSVQEAMLYFPL